MFRALLSRTWGDKGVPPYATAITVRSDTITAYVISMIYPSSNNPKGKSDINKFEQCLEVYQSKHQTRPVNNGDKHHSEYHTSGEKGKNETSVRHYHTQFEHPVDPETFSNFLEEIGHCTKTTTPRSFLPHGTQKLLTNEFQNFYNLGIDYHVSNYYPPSSIPGIAPHTACIASGLQGCPVPFSARFEPVVLASAGIVTVIVAGGYGLYSLFSRCRKRPKKEGVEKDNHIEQEASNKNNKKA